MGAITGGLGGYCGAMFSRVHGWWPGISSVFLAILIISIFATALQFLLLQLYPREEATVSTALLWSDDEPTQIKVQFTALENATHSQKRDELEFMRSR